MNSVVVGVDVRRNTWAPEYGISRVQRCLWHAMLKASSPDLDLLAIDLRGGPLPGPRWEVGSRHGLGARLAQEQWRMRRLSRRLSLLHLPWYEGPLRPSVPHVVTVHDLDTVDRPTGYSRRFRAYYNTLLRSYMLTAARILVPSQTTRNALEDRWPGRPYEVIYHGVDPVFGPTGERLPRASEGPLILYTGGFGSRKRLPDLLAAFEVIASRRAGANLVLVGRAPSDVISVVNRHRHGDRILLTGFLPDPVLAAWYRTADVVAYASELEGFGLPVVEAFASGVPVVTTTSGSIPEIAGGAARLVAPRSPEALAEALMEVVESGSIARVLVEQGLRRARDFSWPVVAQRTLDVYRAALVDV